MNLPTSLINQLSWLGKVLVFCRIVSVRRGDSSLGRWVSIAMELCSGLKNGKYIDLDQFAELLTHYSIPETAKESILQTIALQKLPVSDDKTAAATTDYLLYVDLMIDVLRTVEKKCSRDTYNEKEICDLLDSIHCLPQILVQSSWDETGYWESFIYPVRQKWDAEYLKEREIEIRNKRF